MLNKVSESLKSCDDISEKMIPSVSSNINWNQPEDQMREILSANSSITLLNKWKWIPEGYKLVFCDNPSQKSVACGSRHLCFWKRRILWITYVKRILEGEINIIHIKVKHMQEVCSQSWTLKQQQRRMKNKGEEI